jgi:DNA-binding LacI/PurR family transcriptional regulator
MRHRQPKASTQRCLAPRACMPRLGQVISPAILTYGARYGHNQSRGVERSIDWGRAPVSSKGTTIVDVAVRAAVSRQTVSNVLNGRRASMTDETFQRVTQAIAALGYHPNANARRLRSNHAGAFGLTLIDPSRAFIADPFNVELMAGIGDVLRRNGYELLIHGIDPARSAGPHDALLPLAERRVDGMILVASGSWDQRRPYVEALQGSGYPAVLVQERVQGPQVCCVRTDDMGGAIAATEHLINVGHRSIGFLAGAVSWPAVEARYEGYLRALPDHRWGRPQPLINAVEWTRPSATAAIAAFLASTERGAWPTALFCANVVVAVGALQACKAAGLRVPEDLAIVGFDDMDLCLCTDPQLTTVNLPVYAMGCFAAEALFGWLEDRSFRGQDVVFPAQFVRRRSA